MKLYVKGLFFVFILWNCTAFADVIRMNNGDIHLGKANVTNPESIEIETFGKKIYVQQKDIRSIETDITSVESTHVEVILPDDSILRGQIKNYDDEIGVFLKTSFGEITIPAVGVKQIYDTNQRTHYYGDMFMVSLTGGYYFPFSNLGSNFDADFLAGLTCETNLRVVRGLAIGVHGLFLPMEYTLSEHVTYKGYGMMGRISYRYGDLLFSSMVVLNRIIPFAGIEAGGMYITVKDERNIAPLEMRNALSFAGVVFAGADVMVVRGIALRLEGGVFSLYQGSVYPAFFCSGGINYLF